MPFAWLERWPTRTGGTKSGRTPARLPRHVDARGGAQAQQPRVVLHLRVAELLAHPLEVRVAGRRPARAAGRWARARATASSAAAAVVRALRRDDALGQAGQADHDLEDRARLVGALDALRRVHDGDHAAGVRVHGDDRSVQRAQAAAAGFADRDVLGGGRVRDHDDGRRGRPSRLAALGAAYGARPAAVAAPESWAGTDRKASVARATRRRTARRVIRVSR